MLKDFLKKVAPEFNILAEEMQEIEQNIINKLDKSAKHSNKRVSFTCSSSKVIM